MHHSRGFTEGTNSRWGSWRKAWPSWDCEAQNSQAKLVLWKTVKYACCFTQETWHPPGDWEVRTYRSEKHPSHGLKLGFFLPQIEAWKGCTLVILPSWPHNSLWATAAADSLHTQDRDKEHPAPHTSMEWWPAKLSAGFTVTFCLRSGRGH